MTDYHPPEFLNSASYKDDWREAKLTYEDQGRGGTIWFVSARYRFSMWWEFAGGDALVLIGLPGAMEWKRETGISLRVRDNVAEFIGERVLRDKVGGRGRWTWDDPTLTIYAGV